MIHYEQEHITYECSVTHRASAWEVICQSFRPTVSKLKMLKNCTLGCCVKCCDFIIRVKYSQDFLTKIGQSKSLQQFGCLWDLHQRTSFTLKIRKGNFLLPYRRKLANNRKSRFRRLWRLAAEIDIFICLLSQ